MLHCELLVWLHGFANVAGLHEQLDENPAQYEDSDALCDCSLYLRVTTHASLFPLCIYLWSLLMFFGICFKQTRTTSTRTSPTDAHFLQSSRHRRSFQKKVFTGMSAALHLERRIANYKCIPLV